MANTSKKIKDPTEAALSAIQDALSARDAAAEAQAGISPTPAVSAAEDLQWSGISSAPAADEQQREEQAFSRRAANDDRESIGNILRALQRRPAGTSYVTATVFAGLWVLAGLVLGWMYFPELHSALGPSGLAAPVLAMLAVVFFVPIVFFYVLAHMAWRSQELRLITQSMAEVAMRLAEPETVARESIVTVGQAIRREVAAMGDGVERALARAAELETLVANEVSALEHAYSENEVRIRALLQDLGTQRDTLVGQAGQIRDAINSVHLDLSHDISPISELVAQQVDEASRRITRALGNAGDTMIQTLGERGGDLLDRLENTSRETSQAISGASDRLTTTLNFKTDHIGDEFTEITANIERTMAERLERVTENFAQKSAEILDLMSNRSQELTDLVIETGNQLADTISSRVEEVNTTLKNTGDSLVLDLSLRGGDVVSKLEQTGARITDTIVQRGSRVTDQFRETAEALADVIANRGDAAREMLAARLHAFEEMFNQGSTELTDVI